MPTCRAVRSSLSTTRPRATGSRSASETAAPDDVGRQPRGLMWEPRALDTLEQLAEYMPSAARDALEAMERMASTGFNYGRLTRKGILWYLPTPKLGLFYLDDGRTLIVVNVVDTAGFASCHSVPRPQVGHHLLRVRGDEVRAGAARTGRSGALLKATVP